MDMSHGYILPRSRPKIYGPKTAAALSFQPSQADVGAADQQMA